MHEPVAALENQLQITAGWPSPPFCSQPYAAANWSTQKLALFLVIGPAEISSQKHKKIDVVFELCL